MRQMRGAAAYKRVWYFEEQMLKWSEIIDQVSGELIKLEGKTPGEPQGS
jgi:hypothetical protein